MKSRKIYIALVSLFICWALPIEANAYTSSCNEKTKKYTCSGSGCNLFYKTVLTHGGSSNSSEKLFSTEVVSDSSQFETFYVGKKSMMPISTTLFWKHQQKALLLQ